MTMQTFDIFEHLAREVEGVRQGERSGLTALRELRLLKKHIDDQIAIVDEYAQLEAEKYPGKSFQHTDGTRWTKKDGARLYEYPGNEVIDALLARRLPIDDEIELEKKRAQKARERMDKFQAEVVDGKVVMDGGVLVTPAVLKPTKSSLMMEKG